MPKTWTFDLLMTELLKESLSDQNPSILFLYPHKNEDDDDDDDDGDGYLIILNYT